MTIKKIVQKCPKCQEWCKADFDDGKRDTTGLLSSILPRPSYGAYFYCVPCQYGWTETDINKDLSAIYTAEKEAEAEESWAKWREDRERAKQTDQPVSNNTTCANKKGMKCPKCNSTHVEVSVLGNIEKAGTYAVAAAGLIGAKLAATAFGLRTATPKWEAFKHGTDELGVPRQCVCKNCGHTFHVRYEE